MKKKSIFLVILPCLFLMAGCGKDPKLTAFHDSMNSFYESLSNAAGSLEAIAADPASDTAVNDMLSELDEMASLFEELAAIEVPEQFANVEDLADEAADYMTEADALFHEAYENEDGYDDSIAEAAGEHYARAMKRVNYIAILLQGRIPEDENITVITDDGEPDWNGGEEPAAPDSGSPSEAPSAAE